MIAILIITFLCTLLWILKREINIHLMDKLPIPLIKTLRVPSEHLMLSGNSYSYTLVTSTFYHASRSHLINNMLQLYGINEFETEIGTVPFLILFLTTGAAGWIFSLFWRKYFLYPEQWKQGIAQFQESCGSSPATYGMCIAAATVLGDKPIGNTFNFNPSVWLFGLLFIPKFCGDRFEVNILVHPKKWTIKHFSIASTVLLICYASAEVLVPETLTAERFFLCYLVFNFAASKCEPAKLRRGDKMTFTDADDTTDHACHLGGAILGFGFGAWWYVYHNGHSFDFIRIETSFCILWLFMRMTCQKYC